MQCLLNSMQFKNNIRGCFNMNKNQNYFKKLLTNNGIDKACKKLKINFYDTFLKPLVLNDSNPFLNYKWVLFNHYLVGQVINAIPLNSDFNYIPWEEWFYYPESDPRFNNCKIHHLILYTKKCKNCINEVELPENDIHHSSEVIGRKWYYYDDIDLTPIFLR